MHQKLARREDDDHSFNRLADCRYHPRFLRSETGGILGKANEKRRTSIRCWSRRRPVALSLRAATAKPPCIDPATPTQTVTPTIDDPVYYRSLPSRVLQKFLDAVHDILSCSPLPSLSVGFLDHPNLIDCGQKRLRTGCVRPPHVAHNSKGTVCSMWTWDVTRRVSTPSKSRPNAGWRALRRRASQEIYAENATARFRLKRDTLSDRNLASAIIRRTVSTKSILRSMIILIERMKT